MRKTMTRITKPTAIPLKVTPGLDHARLRKPIDYKIGAHPLFPAPYKPVLLTDPPQLADGVTILVNSLTKMCGNWEGTKQFEGTPARLARMYSELCWSTEKIKHEIDVQFRAFENGYDEMLVGGPVSVWTLCPHHLLPCHFRVWIGYVPKGKVLGLSKLVRVAETLGHRPTMQEQFGADLVKEIWTRLEPKGLGVSIEGVHGCMTSRGVKQTVPIWTTSFKGCIKEEPASRAEFLSKVDASND
jgi:GTP cyclohydrolase I